MSEAPSIRDALEAAAAAQTTTPAADPAPQQIAPPDMGNPIAEQKQPVTEAKLSPTDGAPMRDEHGRFAKPDAAEHSPASETAPPVGQGPSETETTPVPASLPAPLKAVFKDLAPEWQAVFRAQEDQTKAAKDEWGRKGERLNRLDELLAPRKSKYDLEGVDEVTALKRLFAAEDALHTNPVAAIAYLARSSGVQLSQLAQAMGLAAPQGQAPQGQANDPRYDALASQFQTLQQTMAQQQAQAEAARMAEATSEIQQFAADPKHLYFENVKEEMGRLISTGRAGTLAQAYEMATWADPEIRPLLLQAQQAPQPDVQAQARAKAAGAARAAGSITGGPGDGASAQPASKGSIRADLEHAAALQGVRVA